MLWLFAAALVIRLLYVGAGFEVPVQDTADYDEIAHNLLAGEGFVASSNWFGYELRAWRAPLYPLFLSVIYATFGDGHDAVRFVQAVLGALTVVLVYLLTARLHAAAAPAAGWLAVFYMPLVASANEVMTESLFTVLFVAGIAVAIEARHPRDWRWSLGAGLLLGLATLTRPVAMLAVPAILLVSACEDLRRRAPLWGRWLSFAAPLCAGLVVALLPWTVRNAALFGAFVPSSTHGGFIVARSNADEPAWRQAHGWRIDAAVFAEEPDEIERDRRWMAQGLQWIADHPLPWLQLVGERFLRFWYVFQPGYNTVFAFIIPYMLAGMWWRGGSPGFRHLSAVSAFSIAVFCLLLYGSTRFRLPLEPIFLVFVAAAFVEGWRRWRAGFLAVSGCWLACNGLLRLFDDSVRQTVVSMLRAGGLK